MVKFIYYIVTDDISINTISNNYFISSKHSNNVYIKYNGLI